MALTGKIAEDTLTRIIREAYLDVDVLVLPVSVAAFITPKMVIDFIRDRDIHIYEMILVPGMMRGDISLIERETGIPTYLGTVHASDIAKCFSDGAKLSKNKAFEPGIMTRRFVDEQIKTIIETVSRNPASKPIVIGTGPNKTTIGRGLPIPIIAEIVNAPKRPFNEVTALASYYEESGAGIIDIGMVAGEPEPNAIPSLIESIRSVTDLPISVDSLNSKEILASARSEIDLVLSIDSGNMREVADDLRDIPTVILPSNMKKGELPSPPEGRVKKLFKNIEATRKMGLEKIIADPVVEPPIQPGLLNSLIAYRLFREQDSVTPLLIGVGNVTELMDVDSVGVNGLLTAIAYELETNLMLTPESSVKARGSVEELARASRMMFLSASKKVLPKDLGVDLLELKEKRYESYYQKIAPGVTVKRGVRDPEFHPDDSGCFRIQVNYDKKLIEAIYYMDSENPSTVYQGVEATEIYQTIIRDKRINKLDHAAYLGRELQKAEIALSLNRSYIQDEPLFHRV